MADSVGVVKPVDKDCGILSPEVRLLFVESNQGDADLIADMLMMSGMPSGRVERAASLSEATARLGAKPVDAVILDLSLADSAGLDTLRAVRGAAPEAAVIVLTGQDDEQTGMAAVMEGAEDYLVKGRIDRRLLARVIRHAIERRLNKKRQREAELFLHSCLDALAGHIAVLDDKGRILFVNKSWRDFGAANGADSAQINEGANYLAVCDGAKGEEAEMAKRFAGGIRAVFAGRRDSFEMEYPCHTSDEQRWFVGRVTKFPAGGPQRAVVAHETVTARKKAEDALRENEQKYRMLFESAGDAILIYDGSARIVAVNALACEQLGYTHGELVSMTISMVVPPEEALGVPARIARLMAEGSLSFETVHQHKDGTLIPTEVSGRLIDWNGQPAIMSNCRDITERKRAAHDLQTSETRYRRLFESAKDGILILDADTGQIVDVNPFLIGLLGYTRESFLGKKLWEIGSFRDIAASEDAFVDLQKKGYIRYENLPLETRDGSRIEVEFVSNVYPVDSTRVIQCNIRDITDRRRSVEALRASEGKFRSIVDNIGIGVCMIGANMRIIELNQRMREWFPDVRPEEHPFCHGAFNFPPKEEPCSYCPTILTLRDGKVHEATTSTQQQSGARNYRIISSPIKDSEGRVVAAIEMVEDITERLLLQQQLNQAQKMESIGQLAGGVAHDFNNILQAMVGYSSMLLDRLPEHGEMHEFAEEIAKGAERAAALTRQLLAFSRRQVLEMEDTDLNDVVQGLTKMIRRIIGEDIEVKVVEGRRTGMVRADRGQMEQVLLNLCVNARDAMPEGGTLGIETENVVMDREYCDAHAWAAPGRYMLLSVTDTGCGMDAQTLEHMFEPFFTTKELGKGTGLGLATVYGIVRQHQGMVQVYSEVGIGTTFKVYLPSFERTAATLETRVVERARGGSETILLAEDDEALRKLAQRILESAGYTVLLAADGREALDLFEKNAANIDLCLLDVIMPKVGGKAVFDALRPQHPRLRFLFSSGYSLNAISTGFVLQEGVELIQKPYSPDALLRKVRGVLDNPGAASASAPADGAVPFD